MRTLIKILSIVNIILGAIIFFIGIGENDLATVFGGIYWIVFGGLVLAYIGQEKK